MKITSTFDFLSDEYTVISNIIHVLESIKKRYMEKLKIGQTCLICLDCYDLLNWLFPIGFSFHDEHYYSVKALWKTVEKNITTVDQIKLCIPPGAALELFHLLKDKSDFASLVYKDYDKITELLTVSNKKIGTFGFNFNTYAMGESENIKDVVMED